ncbi:MAG: methyltransferase domain-containing protein, partial [Burkholderiaceae bacterium]
MSTTTGFSDVDGSGRSGDLVDYLALMADRLADYRQEGFGLLNLVPGSAVLDVGCGAGEICVELADRVGPAGRIAGVDVSEAMIEAARRAAATVGRDIDLRVASA